MKILENVRTIFNEKLVDLIRQYLEGRIKKGQIEWKAAYDTLLDQTADTLIRGINLTLQDRTSKIDRSAILREMELAKLFLAALDLESRNIDQILGIHELLRKDNVRATTDLKRRYLDIVNHSIQEFRTINIEIKDGRIRLFPQVSQTFFPRELTTIYQPETYEERTGNDPTAENISPGTDKGFWFTTLFTRGNTPVTAKIVLDYVDTISFNRLRVNSAGRFPITLTDVETWDEVTGWTSVHTDDETSKYINVVYPEQHDTSKVRLTLTQSVGEFHWWTDIDNKREILEDETREAAVDDSVQTSIDKDEYTPVVRKVINNVYGFSLGAYNILLFLDIYNGDTDGKFYSRKFTSEEPLETIELARDLEEYKPGSSTITYNLIQQDGSRVSIVPGNKVTLTKTFDTTQTLTNGKQNWVELSSAPLKTGMIVLVNGEAADLVKEFGGSGDLEYIINKNKLYFSVPVEGKTVTVSYNHKTDYVLVEITLNNGTPEAQFDTPFVENFGVLVNGELSGSD